LLAGSALVASPVGAAEREPRQVLILYSYGSNFWPFEEFAWRFRTELAQQSPDTVEFLEAAVESARFASAKNEEPFVDYLGALFEERSVDLVVPVGGAAARFSLEYRERLFPSVPLLLTAHDRRLLPEGLPPLTAVAGTVKFDFEAAATNILTLLPDTREIVVVLGASRMERFWLTEMQRSPATRWPRDVLVVE
jgi:hypothetical protein